jgi:hypothetical protein
MSDAAAGDAATGDTATGDTATGDTAEVDTAAGDTAARPSARAGAPGPSVRRLALAVLVRPWLWPAAAAEVVRLAAPGWWRRWPPLPVPTPELWRLRMITAYGGAGDAEPDVEDVVSFLRWAGRMRRWRKA